MNKDVKDELFRLLTSAHQYELIRNLIDKNENFLFLDIRNHVHLDVDPLLLIFLH
jgi:hypothetical protein